MNNEQKNACPVNSVGGQAVIEGVMMKNGTKVSLAVRRDDGTIEIKNSEFHPIKEKHKALGLPIIRGIVGFFESLILSFKTLSQATDMLGLEDEDDKKKKEKKKGKDGKEKKGESVFIMVLSLILGLALALALFSFLPTFIGGKITELFSLNKDYWYYYPILASIEGVIKIIIFIAYLAGVSLMKDIRRTFQYHGAEHKSIACLEKGLELTPENARGCTRYHPRCGTSFMFVMVLISIIIGLFIRIDITWLRTLIKVAILPLIMGFGYEFIMFAGKHQNWFTRMLSAPGLWMQRITTKEPDDYQLAVAICAIKATMPERYPDFDPSIYTITKEQNKGHIAFTGEKPKKKADTEGQGQSGGEENK